LSGVIGTEEAIELREVSARVTILGSKPWDLELAQYSRTMGSEVTLIESGPQLLPEADREIAQRLGKLLYDAGIVIRRGVAVEAIRRGDDGTLVVVLAEGKGEVVAESPGGAPPSQLGWAGPARTRRRDGAWCSVGQRAHGD